MASCVTACSFAAMILVAAAASEDTSGRWSVAQAQAWYERQPWIRGLNFVPSTSINTTELWQAETFDPATIGRELGWAHDLGFNSTRVFVQYLVWKHDPDGLKKRMEQFLALADQHGLSTMFCLFDDCKFSGKEPYLGKQDDPVPGILGSGWTPSPGHARVSDRSAWPNLEKYITDVVGHFANDKRVIAWDLYNEPGNSGTGNASLPLLEAAFAWARRAKPTQPLTVGPWNGGLRELNKASLQLSDIISFHNYGGLGAVRGQIAALRSEKRPILCTEWMARTLGSTFKTHLPLFKQERVGCYSWGLVNGKMQCQYPWSSKKDDPEPKLWHHDILRRDGSPYLPAELEFLRTFLRGPKKDALLPTADERPVTWRYTTEKPADEWSKPDFDASAWKESPAGFGTQGTPNTVIGTVWKTPDIWLRTTFDYVGSPFKTAAVRIHHDEDATVYLNGEPVLKVAWFITDYELHDATAAIRKALRPGKNVVAVTCHQTTGGQYIDAGIVLDPAEALRPTHSLPALKPLFDFPVRDTSMCTGGDGLYYLTGTTGFPTWWKTNEGIRVWKSADLKTWEPLGLVWTFEKDGTWQKEFRKGNRAIWAPEIHYIKATYWLAYCVNYGGTGILQSATGKAEGPYRDIKPDGPLTGEIDASLFQDDDGKVYFVYQNGKIARMKDDMSGLAEAPKLLKPSNHGQAGFEGAFLTKIGGRYQLVCADFIAGNYHCMVASSEHLFGPYGERYVAVPHGGHNMLFKDKAGAWWSTFFGNDARAPFRERPAILRIELDPDGRVRPLVSPASTNP